jgi:YD repeat-containing protein
MVAIVSGNSAGLDLTSSTQLGLRGSLGAAGLGRSGEQSYVNVASGNLVLQDRDALLVAKGLDVSVVRTYNSQGAFNDDNGDGWMIDAYRNVTNLTGTANTAGSTVQRIGKDGAVVTYDYDATRNLYVAATGSGKFDTLSYDAGSQQWTWTEAATQNQEIYSVNGAEWRLTAAHDANGNTLTYAYSGNLISSITNASGDSVEFSYTGNNLSKESIRQADGTYLSATYYRYDADNRLQQVKTDLSPADDAINDGNVYVTTYSYLGSSNLVSSLVQTDGTQLSLTYVTVGGQQRVASMTDALGRVTSFSYDLTNNATTVTDPLGNSNTYTYDASNRLISVTGPVANGLAQHIDYAYDAAGDLTSAIDAQGNRTTYTYDSNGNLLSVTDGLGNRTENTYDSGNRVLTSTVYRTPANGGTAASDPETTRYVYDANGNARFVVSPEGIVTEYRYNSSGQRVATVTYPAAQYTVSGLGVSQSPSLSTMATWSAAQDQGKTTRVDYQYNVRGQLSKVIAYAAVQSDGTGVTASQSATSFTYDIAGNLLSRIDADNNQTSYTYDGLNRLLAATDAAGHTAINHYDDADHIISHVQINGRVDTSIYDSDGELISSIQGGQAQTEFRYDALGRLVMSIDPTGVKQFYVYDAAGNLQGQVDGNGDVTQYVYNVLGQRVQTIKHTVPLTAAQLAALQQGYATAATAVPATPAANIPAWSATTAYAVGAQVVYGGKVYQVVVANAGIEPDSGIWNAWTEVPVQSVRDWSVTQVYKTGDQISYAGQVFVARWDALGDEPGVNKVWQQVPAAGQTIVPWMAGAQYDTDLQVSYNGQIWQARWDTNGDVPGSSTVWAQSPPAGTYAPWGAGVTYHGGETVSYNGRLWQAGWYDQGVTPGDEGASVWTDVGAAPAAATPFTIFPTTGPQLVTVPLWMSGTSYVTGQTVTYGGQQWTARWDSHNTQPGTDGSWGQSPPAGTYADWMSGVVYVGGETIEYNGHLWLAQWYNQGSVPGVDAVWADQGVAPAKTWSLAGAQTFATNAGDQITRNLYDASGRLAKSIDAGGFVTEYQYDGAGNLVATISRANPVNTSTLTVNSLPQDAVAAPSSQDRTSYQFYDHDNRLIGAVDAENDITQYRYDAAGRLIETVRYANTAIGAGSISTASSFAALVPAANAADQHTYALYDGEGRQIASVNAEGYLTELVYDANGNLTKTISYANKTTVAVTPGMSLASLRPATNAQDQVSQQSYDAFNRVLSATNAEGTVTQYGYDIAGNLIQATTASGTSDLRQINQRYDQFGRVTATLSGLGSSLLTGGQTQAQVDAIWAQYGTTYAYDTAGRRISATDPNGNKTLYYYDQSGNLTQTINALGEVQERQYNALGQLTGTVQYGTRLPSLAGLTGGLGNTTLSAALSALVNSALDSKTAVTYNLDGTVATTTDALGAVTSYGYDAFGDRISRTQQIDATHSVTQTASFDRRGLQTGSVLDPTGLDLASSVQYDAFGRVTGSTDANGKISQRTYDRLGRTVTTTDPTNAQRSTSYDAFGRVLTQTDATGNATTYSYNTANRSYTVTTAEGITSTLTHNREGQTQSVTDGNGNVTAYVYDADGNLLSTTKPLGTTREQYDRADRLTQTTDANGNIVAYAYDAANRLLSRTVDPSGLALTTTYAYDAKGEQISVTDPNGIVTSYSYDLDGHVLTQVLDPTGLAATTSYAYDKAGDVLSVTSPNGAVTRYAYDSEGRRIGKNVDANGLNLVSTYAYDGNGNVTGATDPNGNVTRYVYDADNRLVYTIDNAGDVKKNTYDANGRVTATIAYVTPISLSGLSQSPTMAAIDARVVLSAGQDAIQYRVYDKDGRVRYAVDGTGAVSSYTYDGNGNVVDRMAYATRINLATWTPGTTPPVVADTAHDERIHAVYDAANHAIFTVSVTSSVAGAVTATKYDANGNVVDCVSYATTIPLASATTASAIAAAVASVADATHDVHTRLSYDAANRLAWSVNGVGAVTQLAYDKDGNLVKQVSYATAIAATAAASSVAASSADRVSLFAYDNAGRQVYGVDSLGGVTKNVYDANGNLVRRIAYATAIAAPTTSSSPASVATLASAVHADTVNDRTSTWVYDGANRGVYAIDSLGDVSETRYDADGHTIASIAYATAITASSLASLSVPASTATVAGLIQSDPANDRQTKYAYDAAGRLIYTVDPQGYVTKNSYDALGRIVATTLYANAIAQGTTGTVSAIAAALVPSASTDETNSFHYDAAGNLTSSTDALGHSESSTYDGNGNKLRFTNKNGATWTYVYNAAGQLSSETSPLVALTSTSTDANGNLLAGGTGNLSVMTLFTYDALGNLLARYEAPGRPEGHSTNYQYDALGRQVKVFYPTVPIYFAGSDNLTTNGANSVATRTEFSLQPYSQVSYDTLGNAVANRDVNGNYSYKAYDRDGRVVYDVDAAGYVTQYTRNAFGDATALTRYANAPTLTTSGSTAPTASQLATAMQAASSAADRTVTTTFDRLGRATQVTQPQGWISNGTQSALAAAVTRNTFNAFGQLVQTSVLANSQANTWATTTNYYDGDGRNIATINALGYLTTQGFDAAGNLVQEKEYANAVASWNVAGYTAPTASANDRTITYAYDQANRKTSQTFVNTLYSTAAGVSVRGNVTSTYGYDAVGNQTVLTDPTGATTYTYYDTMGRTTAVAAPTISSTVGGAVLTPLTVYKRDALGNVIVKIAYARSAVAANSSGYTAPTATANDRVTVSRYDNDGNVIQTTDANGVSHFSSYDAAGELKKSWQGVTGNDGITHTLFTAYQYDAVGHLINTITPASNVVVDSAGNISTVSQATAGVVQSQSQFNAFGEVVKQGTNGGWQVYYNYDNAGHMWRTNNGDGTDKVMLYNLQGVQVSMITSAGAGADASLNLGNGVSLAGVSSAQQAEQLAGTRRTDSQVDLLGRVTSITMAARSGTRPVINQTFDRWGNTLSRSSLYGANSVTTYQYNDQNQLILQKDPDGNGQQSSDSPLTQVYYDKLGRQIAMIDANGNVTTKTWDADGNDIQDGHADGGTVRAAFNAFGEQVVVTDADGNTTTNQIDHLGQVTQSSTDLVGVYSVSSSFVLSGSQQHLLATSRYDEAGRITWTTDSSGAKTSYTYDLRGNITSKVLPLGQVETYAYDNQGQHIASKDANGAVSTWNYDYFKLLLSRKDIGGASYTYTYDAERQLVHETNTRGLNVLTSYDGAGQVTQIKDVTQNQVTLYTYNIAGQRIREQTIQGGKSYQDNWLAYNAQGRLARIDASDDGLSVVMTYDKVGNMVHNQTTQQALTTHTISKQVTIDGAATTVTHDVIGVTASAQSLWYAYDGMQRQVLVDGAVDGNVNNVNNVTSAQGHVITYDKDGNRISDTSWGEQIVAQRASNGSISYVDHTGMITTYYGYDHAGRLSTVSIGAFDSLWNALPAANAVVVGQYYYDGAGNTVQEGAGDQMPAAYRAAVEANTKLASTLSTTMRRYDANGRLLIERVTELNGALRSQSDYTSAGSYDAEGNLLYYVATDATSVSQIVTTQGKMDGYVRTSLVTTKTVTGKASTVSTTTYNYNANSGLVNDVYTAKAGATPVTTAYIKTITGGVLQTADGTTTSRNLRVGSHVYASWSSGAASTPGHVDTHTPRIQNYDESGNAMVQVQAGETLQSLAQMAYGDSSLWYVIANANGISNNTDLSVGSYITIPSDYNGTSLHSDYGWSGAATSTDTNFWDVVPGSGGDDGGCGGLGSIVMVVVAVVVSVFAPELIPALGEMISAGGALEVVGYAAAAAVGSVASQVVGNAIGAENGFSWSQVGVAALAGGVTAGIGGANGSIGAAVGGGTPGAIAAAAVSNVITQGVSVAVGLQDSFSWKGVVAAAVGAGVGDVVSTNLNNSTAFAETFGSASKYVGQGVAKFSSGVSQSLVRGGKVDVAVIAADAFGNALGSSLADQMQQGSQQSSVLYSAEEQAQDFARENNRFASAAAMNAQTAANGLPASYWNMYASNDVADPSQSLELARLDGQATAELGLHRSLGMVPAQTVSGPENNSFGNNTSLNVVGKTADGGWRFDTGAISYPVDLSSPEVKPLPSLDSGSIQAAPGYWSTLQNIYNSDLPVSQKLGMAWDNTKFYYQGSQRAQGLVQAAGGAGEFVGAGLMSEVPPVAVIVGLHGYDNLRTGINRVFSGNPENTTTYNVANDATGSPQFAGDVEKGIGFIGLVGGVGGTTNVATTGLGAAESIGGATELLAARKATASAYYKTLGWDDARIASHTSGIDFSQPVEVVPLLKGSQVVQYQIPGNPVGGYFAPVGTPAESIGISSVGREPIIYVTTQDVSVLRSSAADTSTNLSLPENARGTGGGTQYFTNNRNVFQPLGY